MSGTRRIDFAGINRAALNRADVILARWLPDGQIEGSEYVALNPKRKDQRRGSFKVNVATGAWGDFAADAAGGDLISLAAYLGDLSQGRAAIRLAQMLGVDAYDR